MGGSFERQASRCELLWTQWLEPDAVGGLVHGSRELALHTCPNVIQLGAHGSVQQLLLGSRFGGPLDGGPAQGPASRIYPKCWEWLRPRLAIGEKIPGG